VTLRVFLGYDEREPEAYRVAARTLSLQCPDAHVTKLDAERLRACGLLRRVQDNRSGKAYDLVSNAHCSTDFAFTRFFVPILAQEGWALFTDSDVVFLGDPREMFAEVMRHPDKAVYVVKHEHVPKVMVKMDGQPQQSYPRKNWSSVVLWNCDHPGNRRLTVQDVNTRTGRELHRFYWLADSEIGELSPRWNWLVGEQPRPPGAKVAHFTQGGPFTPGWTVGDGEHDALWLEASEQ
jgi:hypothetical protein